MTDERRQVDEGLDADDDSRRQLWFRAGVAGGLIALLLGALAVFDHLSKPTGNPEVALPTKPIAPAQVASDAGRDAPPEVIRAGADGAQAEVQEEPPAAEASAPPLLPRDATGADAPVDRLEVPRTGTGRPHQATQPGHGRETEHRAVARSDETPRATVTPPPAAAVPPRSPVAPPAQQASQSPQRDAPPAAGAAAPRPIAPQSAGAPALAGGPPPAAPTPAPAAPQSSSVPAATGTPSRAPAAQVSAPVAQAPAPAAEGVGRGYVLQFGFFSSAARAEELKARLAQAGIPAQVETRLVVGPFADRKEALAAQARLREKGIDTGVLLPLGR